MKDITSVPRSVPIFQQANGPWPFRWSSSAPWRWRLLSAGAFAQWDHLPRHGGRRERDVTPNAGNLLRRDERLDLAVGDARHDDAALVDIRLRLQPIDCRG